MSRSIQDRCVQLDDWQSGTRLVAPQQPPPARHTIISLFSISPFLFSHSYFSTILNTRDRRYHEPGSILDDSLPVVGRPHALLDTRKL
ncbi:hypothetical protein FLAG1_06977 [Fusarium langsethiae]|uniref:Uncharacterized protein n=1 Tax=Fusarium langsethiae TaxID=179993 RepID=A0A0M9EUY2_FUSLA|nr:hypothetical protein FLAG1_06977 [Fusarium langsethiae]